MTKSIPERKTRVVAFSRYSQMALIPKDKLMSKKWYSSQDRYCFRQDMNEAVRRLSREAMDDKLSQSNVHECVGIEVFLNKDLARRIMEARCSHIKAVLSEQSRQKRQGICDAEKLAAVSTKTSWTQERARNLAIDYWLQHILEK